MTGTEALELWRQYLLARLPGELLEQYNIAYEVLRKLVVDDIARRKNSAETEKYTK